MGEGRMKTCVHDGHQLQMSLLQMIPLHCIEAQAVEASMLTVTPLPILCNKIQELSAQCDNSRQITLTLDCHAFGSELGRYHDDSMAMLHTAGATAAAEGPGWQLLVQLLQLLRQLGLGAMIRTVGRLQKSRHHCSVAAITIPCSTSTV